MSKYTYLMLLAAVTIACSHAASMGRYSWRPPSLSSVVKREIDASEMISDEGIEEIAKTVLAEMFLNGAKPEERPALIQKYREIFNHKKHATMEYFISHLVEGFEEVTGRPFSFDNLRALSDESSDESFVDSPVASRRATEV